MLLGSRDWWQGGHSHTIFVELDITAEDDTHHMYSTWEKLNPYIWKVFTRLTYDMLIKGHNKKEE